MFVGPTIGLSFGTLFVAEGLITSRFLLEMDSAGTIIEFRLRMFVDSPAKPHCGVVNLVAMNKAQKIAARFRVAGRCACSFRPFMRLQTPVAIEGFAAKR